MASIKAYKELVENIIQAQTEEDINKICGKIDRAYQSDTITFNDNEQLYRLLTKRSEDIENRTKQNNVNRFTQYELELLIDSVLVARNNACSAINTVNPSWDFKETYKVCMKNRADDLEALYAKLVAHSNPPKTIKEE